MAENTPSQEGARMIKSVVRAGSIMETIQEQNAATLDEIAAESELTKGTVHTYLRTLEECGFVTEDQSGFRLGLRFITMGEHVRNEMDLYVAGQEEVDSLAKETGEYAHLVVESGGREVAIYESRGEYAIAMDYHLRMRETPQYLHDSAAGKAILAHSEPDRLDEILRGQELEAQTSNTITDEETLRDELETVRTRGFAVNDEEEVRGMRAVGAPILDSDGSIIGAVSLTAPAGRLKDERFTQETPELVMETANLIELNLETAQFERNP